MALFGSHVISSRGYIKGELSVDWVQTPFALKESIVMKNFNSLVLLAILPSVYCQLNTLATAAGKKYFGTATDNPELTDVPYVAQLGNTADFNQITAVKCI